MPAYGIRAGLSAHGGFPGGFGGYGGPRQFRGGGALRERAGAFRGRQLRGGREARYGGGQFRGAQLRGTRFGAQWEATGKGRPEMWSRARSHMWTPKGTKTLSTGRIPGTRKLGWRERATVTDDFTAYMTGKEMVKPSVVEKQWQQLEGALAGGGPIPLKD